RVLPGFDIATAPRECGVCAKPDLRRTAALDRDVAPRHLENLAGGRLLADAFRCATSHMHTLEPERRVKPEPRARGGCDADAHLTSVDEYVRQIAEVGVVELDPRFETDHRNVAQVRARPEGRDRSDLHAHRANRLRTP